MYVELAIIWPLGGMCSHLSHMTIYENGSHALDQDCFLDHLHIKNLEGGQLQRTIETMKSATLNACEEIFKLNRIIIHFVAGSFLFTVLDKWFFLRLGALHNFLGDRRFRTFFVFEFHGHTNKYLVNSSNKFLKVHSSETLRPEI